MKYISLLRGINVAGHKKIKMADLKELYQSLGLEKVSTYIQTGNVIFDSNKTQLRVDLKQSIEKAIEDHYGFSVPADLRTHKELLQIVAACPYEEAKIEQNGTKVLVMFLHSIPSEEKQALLLEYVKAPEKLMILGSEIFLFCPKGYGRSKLTNAFIEKKLGVSSTTRNWKSVNKLCELSAA